MIGVLAVIAILASALLPAMIKRIDVATRNAEVATLVNVSNALALHVLRSNTIPDGAWAVTNWSDLSSATVSTNTRRYNRIYFTQTSPTPASLPYVQTVTGTTQPQKLRAMVVSILGGDVLTSGNCPSPGGGTLSDSDFDALWSTADGSRPSTGLWANWNGKGDDFLIRRVDYAPLFHRLILVNRDSNNAASFRINGSAPVALLNNVTNAPPGWNSYYTDGSVISLCTGAAGITNTHYVLRRDISFVYEAGLWRADVAGSSTANPLANSFGANAQTFLKTNYWNTGAFQGANQQGVMTAMYSFMLTYTFWANQCPRFPWRSGTTYQQVPEYELMSNIGDNNARLDVFSSYLIK